MRQFVPYLRHYSTKPQLPKCDFIPKKYKGLPYDEMLKIRNANINPVLGTFYSKPLALHQGYKQWLFDIEGKRYLDMFGGVCTVSVGHSHPKINEAVKEQIDTLGHTTTLYLNTKILEYAEKLAEKLPGNLKNIYFVNSGSEANDLALLMARAYTGKFEVMSIKNCYHGMTYQTMGLTSNNNYKYPVPGPGGMLKTLNPDVYRGLWGGNKCRDSPVQTDKSCDCQGECQAGLRYLEQFEDELKHDVPKTGLAAFWAESIQGLGGVVQYPKNFIKGVHEIVKSNGGLYVADEVQTGFGRTGDHFWGFQGLGVIPDIVTMAKGIANGYPLAAVATTREIASALNKAAHFNTFGGNPIVCTVGQTVLEIIEEEKLQENSKTVGTYLLLELEKLKSKFPVIGDVRGKGLMIGVDLVQDRDSKKPLDPARILKFWEKCLDLGLIIGKGGLCGNVSKMILKKKSLSVSGVKFDSWNNLTYSRSLSICFESPCTMIRDKQMYKKT